MPPYPSGLPRCRCRFSVLENHRVSLFNEAWIPFCLDELPDGEGLALDDVDAYIPFLTEKWPTGGVPNRTETLRPGQWRNPPGVSGWLVFRLPPKERPVDPTAPTIDWDAIRDVRLRSRED